MLFNSVNGMETNITNTDIDALRKQFIEKYYEGDFDINDKKLTEEIIQGIKLIADDEQTQKILHELFYSDDGKDCGSLTKALNKFNRRIGSGRKTAEKISLGKLAMRIAVAIIPVAIIAGVWFFYDNITTLSQSKVVEYSALEKQEDVTLPDNSKITIEAGTELKFSENKHERKVDMSGKCLFRVEENIQKPFVISTRDLTIRVLGTTFNVEARKESDTTIVALHSGKVTVVLNNGKEFFLEPSQKLYYISGDEEVIVEDVNNIIEPALKAPLIINDASLREVIEAIEEYYGVKFEIPTGVQLGGQYTLVYKENESLDKVLTLLSHANSMYSYSVVDDNKVIMSKIN